jgi:putative SOS response-associated peptidase YedK
VQYRPQGAVVARAGGAVHSGQVCGRLTVTTTKDLLHDFQIAIGELPADVSAPRYNVAPTQSVATVSLRDGVRDLRTLRWGITAPWRGHGGTRGPLMINAQLERVDATPIFRDSFRKRRCLVPADGFFEWVVTSGKKQPIWFHREDGHLFGFAALWRDDEFTILTTKPNSLVAPVHDRMPVVIDPSSYAAWLDPRVPPALARELCATTLPSGWRADAVNPRVNNVANDDADCIALANGSPPTQMRLL